MESRRRDPPTPSDVRSAAGPWTRDPRHRYRGKDPHVDHASHILTGAEQKHWRSLEDSRVNVEILQIITLVWGRGAGQQLAQRQGSVINSIERQGLANN